MAPRKISAHPSNLAHEARRLLQRVTADFDPINKRLVIALAGCPGNGKTTVAAALAAAINAAAASGAHHGSGGNPICAIAVSMDGFHYPKFTLDTFSDRALAHARRGAPFTFDAGAYLAAISSLVHPLGRVPTPADDDDELLWPGFDHRVGDPVPGAIRITRAHKIVIVEGLYVLSSPPPPPPPPPTPGLAPSNLQRLSHTMHQPEWAVASSLVHEQWWVCVSPEDLAETRLAERHVRTGLAKNLTCARERIRANDALNAAWVKASVDWAGVDVVVDNSADLLQTQP